MGQLINFEGRIRRMGWWIAGIATSIVSAIFENFRSDPDTATILVIIFAIIGFVLWLISLSLSVRRWHDLNKSGWWILINLIPIIGWIYSLIQLGFMPGDQGNNSYGPPPREGAILG